MHLAHWCNGFSFFRALTPSDLRPCCRYPAQDIHHERAWLHSRIDQVVVKCVVETTGKEHTDAIIAGLRKKYPVTREDP